MLENKFRLIIAILLLIIVAFVGFNACTTYQGGNQCVAVGGEYEDGECEVEDDDD